MDSDDVSDPQRFEKQIADVEAHPAIDANSAIQAFFIVSVFYAIDA